VLEEAWLKVRESIGSPGAIGFENRSDLRAVGQLRHLISL
jgi:hypothetical protein